MTKLVRIAVALGVAWSMPAAADDGRPARHPIEADVLEEINYARQNPREYAAQLRDYRQFFKGNIVYLPGDDAGMMTEEGLRAVDEAIEFLERQRPVAPLDHGDLLALAAQDHAADQGLRGATGHASRDGTGPGERVRRRGGDIYVGESISYGYADPQGVVRQLIVDDGVPNRGHRKLLFQASYRYAGIGCGEHARYRHMCVVDFAATSDGNPSLPSGMAAARPPSRTASR